MSEQTGKVLVCNKCGRRIPAGCGVKHEAGELCGAKLGDGGMVPASGTCDGSLIYPDFIIEHGTAELKPRYKAMIESAHRECHVRFRPGCLKCGGDRQKDQAVEVQRQRVNELHLRRGEEVQLAREIREQGRAGETEPDLNAAWREDYDAQWEKVEELSEQIGLEELALATLERNARPFMGLLDALTQIADMPDYDPEAGVTVEQLARQYDEARDLANAARGAFLLLGVAQQAEERERVCKEVRAEMDADDAAAKRYMIRYGEREKYLRVEWRGRLSDARIVMDWQDKGECFELAHSDALAIRKAYETITGDDLASVEEVDNG